MTAKHKHEWEQILDHEDKNYKLKVYNCKGCPNVKVDTSRIINDSSEIEEFIKPKRNTEKIPAGENEFDRLVMIALLNNPTSSLRQITDRFNELLKKVDKTKIKESIQIVSDRLHAHGFEKIEPVYFEKGYDIRIYDDKYPIEYTDDGREVVSDPYLDSDELAEKIRLLKKWDEFYDIKSSTAQKISKHYDKHFVHLAVLTSMMENLFWELVEEKVEESLVVEKSMKKFGWNKEKTEWIINEALKHSDFMRDGSDNIIPWNSELIKTRIKDYKEKNLNENF